MKNIVFGSALALSMVASSAFAEGDAPVMTMDEQVIVKEAAHIGNAGSSADFLIPFIFVLLVAAAMSGGGSSGGMSY